MTAIIILGVLSDCGTLAESAGSANSTTAATAQAQARKVAQETERLRRERDLLRAQLSAQAQAQASEQAGTTARVQTDARVDARVQVDARVPADAQAKADVQATAKADGRVDAQVRADAKVKATKGTSPKSSAPTIPAPVGQAPSLSGSASFQASFAALAARLSGSEGVAYTSGGAAGTTALGSWRTGVGWSTVKVPVALAVAFKAQGRPDAGTRRLMRLAITASDNAAAEQLWSSLGSPRTAAAKVEAVLRSGGDGVTRVQSQRVRPQFTSFGQTPWSLTNQATFVAAVPCLRYSSQVLQLMGAVEPGQRWGIGAAGRPASFKGGWGPGRSGKYLVRQMGIVTLASGSQLGLAIASEPADGKFSTGTANLTALARWVVVHATDTGPRRC